MPCSTTTTSAQTSCSESLLCLPLATGIWGSQAGKSCCPGASVSCVNTSREREVPWGPVPVPGRGSPGCG